MAGPDRPIQIVFMGQVFSKGGEIGVKARVARRSRFLDHQILPGEGVGTEEAIPEIADSAPGVESHLLADAFCDRSQGVRSEGNQDLLPFGHRHAVSHCFRVHLP